jgi:hypothetical protein
MYDFFVRSLLCATPPEWNRPAPGDARPAK